MRVWERGWSHNRMIYFTSDQPEFVIVLQTACQFWALRLKKIRPGLALDGAKLTGMDPAAVCPVFFLIERLRCHVTTNAHGVPGAVWTTTHLKRLRHVFNCQNTNGSRCCSKLSGDGQVAAVGTAASGFLATCALQQMLFFLPASSGVIWVRLLEALQLFPNPFPNDVTGISFVWWVDIPLLCRALLVASKSSGWKVTAARAPRAGSHLERSRCDMQFVVPPESGMASRSVTKKLKPIQSDALKTFLEQVT